MDLAEIRKGNRIEIKDKEYLVKEIIKEGFAKRNGEAYIHLKFILENTRSQRSAEIVWKHKTDGKILFKYDEEVDLEKENINLGALSEKDKVKIFGREFEVVSILRGGVLR